jgi:hypothetical protein
MRRRPLIAALAALALALAIAGGAFAQALLAVPEAVREEQAAREAGYGDLTSQLAAPPAPRRPVQTRLAHTVVGAEQNVRFSRIVREYARGLANIGDSDYEARISRGIAALPTPEQKAQALTFSGVLLFQGSNFLLDFDPNHPDARTIPGTIRLFQAASRAFGQAIRLDPTGTEAAKLNLEHMLREIQAQQVKLPRNVGRLLSNKDVPSRLFALPATSAKKASDGGLSSTGRYNQAGF